MTSFMSSHRRGFTLIEVIVALAIAGGSMILLLSACRHSMQRSLRAQQLLIASHLAESAADELLLSKDGVLSGGFPQHPGWSWAAQLTPASVEDVAGLERMVLSVNA